MKYLNQVLAASDTANFGVDEVEKSGILLNPGWQMREISGGIGQGLSTYYASRRRGGRGSGKC